MSKIEVIDGTDVDLQQQIRDGVDRAIDESIPLFHPVIREDGTVTALDYDTGRVDAEAVRILRDYHLRMQKWHEARGVDGPALVWHASYADVLGQLLERLLGVS